MPGEIINGTADGEELNGGNEGDIINGGYGNDVINGGAGNDTIGGGGSDLLIGGAGNDVFVLGSDTGEPVVAQYFNPNEGRNDEIDPVTRRLYPNQPFVADDIAVGGEGADTFLIKPQINAKADITAKHTDDDDRINWAGVAGENNNVHDHWVDAFGTEVIADYDKSEGDQILISGHTVDPEISYADIDGDRDEESIIRIYSNQGARGDGAHNGDFLGQVIVHGDRVEGDDLRVKNMETYGIVESIVEIMEAVAPTGESDQNIESTATQNPFAGQVETRETGENTGPTFVEDIRERLTVAAEDNTLTGTEDNGTLVGDPMSSSQASLNAPLSYWSFAANENGEFTDARGASNAAFYLYDNNNNNQAVLQDSTPVFPGPNGQAATLFGSNGKTFAYINHDDSYEVLNATITAWFNPVDLGDRQTLISKDEGNADGGGHFHIRIEDDGRLFIRVAEGEGKNDGGYNHEWRTCNPIIAEGNWQHIALTISATGVAVFLNGQQIPDNQFETVNGAGGVSMGDFLGGYGTDTLDGGEDNDELDGGHGMDVLNGGAGNDRIVSRADNREPEIAQQFDRSDDPDYEVDFATWRVYPSQANMPSDDMLSGSAGADEFFFQTLINAKFDIINKHVNDDRTINWTMTGVAGENDDVHDHWVDGIGNDTILDSNRDERDTIVIDGHTTEVGLIERRDVDGNSVEDSILHLRSNQGNGGGAHDGDLLGRITVLNARITEEDFTTNAASHAGIVETIDEYLEAIIPLNLVDLATTLPPLPTVTTTSPPSTQTATPEPTVQAYPYRCRCPQLMIATRPLLPVFFHSPRCRRLHRACRQRQPPNPRDRRAPRPLRHLSQRRHPHQSTTGGRRSAWGKTISRWAFSRGGSHSAPAAKQRRSEISGVGDRAWNFCNLYIWSASALGSAVPSSPTRWGS